jgi:hypothetical protein
MLHREWFTLKQSLLLIDDLESKGWIKWKRTYPRTLILLTKHEQKDIIFVKANRGFLSSDAYKANINDYFCIVSSLSSALKWKQWAGLGSGFHGWQEIEAELRRENIWSNVTETNRAYYMTMGR